MTEENMAGSEVADDEISSSQQIKYCVFTAGDEEYAVPLKSVREVVKYGGSVKIPQTPSYVLGLANVRGNTFGILDVGSFFQDRPIEGDPKFLLVIDHDDHKVCIALNDVPRTLTIFEDTIKKMSASVTKTAGVDKYIKGLIKDEDNMVTLFDITGIITSPNFTEVY